MWSNHLGTNIVLRKMSFILPGWQNSIGYKLFINNFSIYYKFNGKDRPTFFNTLVLTCSQSSAHSVKCTHIAHG